MAGRPAAAAVAGVRAGDVPAALRPRGRRARSGGAGTHAAPGRPGRAAERPACVRPGSGPALGAGHRRGIAARQAVADRGRVAAARRARPGQGWAGDSPHRGAGRPPAAGDRPCRAVVGGGRPRCPAPPRAGTRRPGCAPSRPRACRRRAGECGGRTAARSPARGRAPQACCRGTAAVPSGGGGGPRCHQAQPLAVAARGCAGGRSGRPGRRPPSAARTPAPPRAPSDRPARAPPGARRPRGGCEPWGRRARHHPSRPIRDGPDLPVPGDADAIRSRCRLSLHRGEDSAPHPAAGSCNPASQRDGLHGTSEPRKN
jgi:hypothetical protein